MFGPLEQFQIVNLFYNAIGSHSLNPTKWSVLVVDIYNTSILFTNLLLLTLFLSFIFSTFISLYSHTFNKLRYTLWNTLINLLFKALDILLATNSPYSSFLIPLYFTLFFLLLGYNVYGMLPFSFTETSHIICTIYLSFLFFFSFNIISVKLFGKKVFKKFVPKKTPLIILPALFIIELISYISRLFSLAIRLFANMMSGHTLLHILTEFLYKVIVSKDLLLLGLCLLPITIIHGILTIEISIAFLQIYVFLVLISLYLADSFLPKNNEDVF